ncbi:hypothetical protein [Streptomyces sp. NPDC006784]
MADNETNSDVAYEEAQKKVQELERHADKVGEAALKGEWSPNQS